MKLFVIMDRATGRYLPRAKRASYVEFSDETEPRLFTRRGSAVNAMRCWKKGYWRTKVTGYGFEYDKSTPFPDVSDKSREVAERRSAMDLAVVEVRITEVLL